MNVFSIALLGTVLPCLWWLVYAVLVRRTLRRSPFVARGVVPRRYLELGGNDNPPDVRP